MYKPEAEVNLTDFDHTNMEGFLIEMRCRIALLKDILHIETEPMPNLTREAWFGIEYIFHEVLRDLQKFSTAWIQESQDMANEIEDLKRQLEAVQA
ncbi:hypothetical protein [Desulfatibacillum aliphaticivorans]|uniref:hypothetical protein n=1 Tax=Desulfatibacillum aliphaticivorans TaxID=218208 RepID=UPI0012FC2DCD|nr:hypothetical protein [Desulfatibacillum aliphaticivorans]